MTKNPLTIPDLPAWQALEREGKGNGKGIRARDHARGPRAPKSLTWEALRALTNHKLPRRLIPDRQNGTTTLSVNATAVLYW